MTIKPRVKKMKVENHMYTKEKPNPEWKTKGEKWIDFALNKWKPMKAEGKLTKKSKSLDILWILIQNL